MCYMDYEDSNQENDGIEIENNNNEVKSSQT